MTRLYISPTSKGQAWGQGKKMSRNPQPSQMNDYGRTRHKSSKYYNFDPTPAALRYVSKKNLDDFVKDNQILDMKRGFMSNWSSVLKFSYNDYNIDEQRKQELAEKSISNINMSVIQGTSYLSENQNVSFFN